MRRNNETKKHGTEPTLESIRSRSLCDTARAVKSIREQRRIEGPEDEMLRVALSDSEDAMIMLAIKASDDDPQRTQMILDEHDLGDLK